MPPVLQRPFSSGQARPPPSGSTGRRPCSTGPRAAREHTTARWVDGSSHVCSSWPPGPSPTATTPTSPLPSGGPPACTPPSSGCWPRAGRGACASLRWHSFRHRGAAQLHGLGAPPSAIHVYGGWASPKVAQLYTRAPSGWGFKRGSGLPFLAQEGKRVRVEDWPGTTFGMFPSWVRREIVWAPQRLSGGRRPREMVDAATKAKRPRMMTPTTSEVEVQPLAKEVAGLRGVRPGGQGSVFRAIAKMGEGQRLFSRGVPHGRHPQGPRRR